MEDDRQEMMKFNRNMHNAQRNHNQMNLTKKNAKSVKSLQKALQMGTGDDDCLYLNLEEEYLQRVTKRQVQGSNFAINRSMYNFKA